MKYSKCKHKINLHGSIKYFYIVLFLGKQRNSIILNIYLRIILGKGVHFLWVDFSGLFAHCALSAWRLGGPDRQMNKAPLALGTVNSRSDCDCDVNVDVFLIFSAGSSQQNVTRPNADGVADVQCGRDGGSDASSTSSSL